MPKPGRDEFTLSRARRRVLEALRESDAALSLSELSERTGSHENTLRDHLVALIADGLAASHAVAAGARGRPAHRYSAVALPQSGPTALAAALALEVAALPDAPEIAVRAGRRWGAELGDVPRDALLTRLGELGFAPIEVDEGIVLRACPLIEVAEVAPGVICRMHLAALTEGLGPDVGVDLVAWGHPEGCLLAVSPAE